MQVLLTKPRRIDQANFVDSPKPREVSANLNHAPQAFPTEQSRRPSLRLIVLLGSVSAFAPLAIDMYLPAFPSLERDLVASSGAVQLTLSLFLAGLGFGQLICGPISDRIGRRAPLTFGCFAFALAAGLCAFTPSIEVLIASRFLMGLGGACAIVVSRAVVRDLFTTAESAGVYSMLMLVSGIAPIVAPSVGGLLLGAWGWRSIFAVLAFCGAASGAAVAFDLKEPLEDHRRSNRSFKSLPAQYAAIFCDSRFLPYAIGFGASLLFAYIAGSPFAFMQLYGVSAGMFGILFSGNAIGLIGCAQINRFMVRRFGLHPVLKTAIVVNALAAVALFLVTWTGTGGFAAFYLCIFVCLSSLGFIFPNATAAAMAPFAAQAGTASALLGVMQYGLGAFVGAIMGLLDNGTALPMATIIALCGLSAALVILLSERHRTRHL